MKTILNRLINHEILSKAEAKDVLVNISAGNYNTSQISSFLTVYMMRSITIEELSGLADDIFMYFGLGCRNVSKLRVAENYNFKTFFSVEMKL